MPYLSKLAKRITLGWSVAVLFVAGCAVPDATAIEDQDPELVPARIRITQNVTDLLEGDSAQFTAIVMNHRGVPLTDQPISWRSSDPSILTVSNTGTGVAIDTGDVSVVAAVASLEETVRLKPRQRPVTAVIVSPNPASVQVGGNRVLGLTLLNSRGQTVTGRVVTWSSSRPEVATVDANGRVTAVTVGTASIIATSEGVTGTSSVTTTPIPAPSTVSNLAVSAANESSVTLSFTQVNDGTGAPSRYIMRYAPTPFAWNTASVVSSGTCAAPIAGTTVGATLSCTVLGLNASTTYGFQVVAVRGTIGPDAVYGTVSNVVTASTSIASVATVTVSPATATVQVGAGTTSLSATLRDANNGILSGRSIAWTSSNTAIATVSSTGVVTPVAAGSATITATSEGRSGTAAITVNAAAAPGNVADLRVASVTDTSVQVAFTEVQNGLGQPSSYDVRFAVSPLAWGSAISVSRGTCSSPLAGVTVGQTRTCTILGLAPGTAYQFQLVAFRGTLDVNAVFGQQSNVVSATTTTVTVPPVPAAVASVVVSPASANLTVGGATATLAATLRDSSNAILTGRTITWSSSNNAVATVSQSGVVTPVAAGSVSVTATSGGRSGSAAIQVANPAPAPVSSVTLSPSSASLTVGGASTTLVASLRDALNALLTGRTIAWSSSSNAVATVSQSGIVTPVAAGTATITATSEGRTGTATITVSNPTVPLPAAEPVPAGPDVVIYDDDFSGYATLEQRRARRNQLMSGSAPFYFFDGPDAGTQREAIDSIIPGGYGSSPYAYRIRMPASMNNYYQATMNGEVFHRSPNGSVHFNPAGTTLVVDMWIRVNYPAANLYWIKGLEMFHNYDRTQFSVYLASATLGWANIHAQSNNREIYMHVENGASDAPVANRRWNNISDGTWKKHTFVYRPSSGTGTARDGINRWYVNGELIIDASQAGKDRGWMLDRVNGASATSTNPYPGNVGEKYTNVTGDQALLGLSDDPVIQLIFPGIFSTSATGGGGTIDVGRIRVWYR